jgi:hypothetical protein
MMTMKPIFRQSSFYYVQWQGTLLSIHFSFNFNPNFLQAGPFPCPELVFSSGFGFPRAHNYGSVMVFGPKAFQKYDIRSLKLAIKTSEIT